VGFLAAVLTARVVALTSAGAGAAGAGPAAGESSGSSEGAGATSVLAAAGVVFISIIIKEFSIPL